MQVNRRESSAFAPSREVVQPWAWAFDRTGRTPEHTPGGGKWLLYVPPEGLDAAWAQIRHATESGRLGSTAKAATARPGPFGPDKVICVYTYDAADRANVMQVREELRRMGFTQRLAYKTDEATRLGLYARDGFDPSLLHA